MPTRLTTDSLTRVEVSPTPISRFDTGEAVRVDPAPTPPPPPPPDGPVRIQPEPTPRPVRPGHEGHDHKGGRCICFAAGSHIETPAGPVRVEELAVGELVQSVDNGPRPLRWVGWRQVPAVGRLAPVRFAPGALGNDQALLVSPQHRVLLTGWRAELYGGQAELLVPAIALVNGDTITRQPGGEVRYFHLMFDDHELIRSEGMITESFYPGAEGWRALTAEARDEISQLFPHLRADPTAYGPAVRPVVTVGEARLLFG